MRLLHLSHLVVRRQRHDGVYFVDLIEARARPRVVVDDAAGLQVGIDGDRSDILEALLLQFPADPLGQPVDSDTPVRGEGPRGLRTARCGDGYSFFARAVDPCLSSS